MLIYPDRLESLLKEYIKSYNVFSSYDPVKAGQYLALINDLRLQSASLAEQRQNFYDELIVPGTTAGYQQDISYVRDDINYLVNRFVASLDQTTLISLLHQGVQKIEITRQPVQWQQLMSNIQTQTAGQQYPFDLPSEIRMDKNQALLFGVINQTDTGYIFPHGCNLKDDYSPYQPAILEEINKLDYNGNPCIPQPRIVPLLFKFTGGADTQAIAADGGNKILTTKLDESVLLMGVSTTSINSRMTIVDRGRNQTWATRVESLGIAGFFTDQYATYYPLPYPHLLRRGDRIEIEVLNGSDITGDPDDADVTQTLAFIGRTI